jgi:hypothetical protein
MNHINASVENVERPLMTPDDASRLRPAKRSGKPFIVSWKGHGHL